MVHFALPVLMISLGVGALVSGLAAIGSGSRWQFETKHLLQGRVDAVLYCWVIASTMLTMFQIYVLLRWWDYIKTTGMEWDDRRVQAWIYHGTIATLFIAAHLFIKWFLSHDAESRTFLWGHRAAVR